MQKIQQFYLAYKNNPVDIFLKEEVRETNIFTYRLEIKFRGQHCTKQGASGKVFQEGLLNYFLQDKRPKYCDLYLLNEYHGGDTYITSTPTLPVLNLMGHSGLFSVVTLLIALRCFMQQHAEDFTIRNTCNVNTTESLDQLLENYYRLLYTLNFTCERAPYGTQRIVDNQNAFLEHLVETYRAKMPKKRLSP